MQNYFENELTMMEKEIRWLKTSLVKSGATITSVIKSVDYSIPLQLVGGDAKGSANFIVNVDEACILVPNLDLYYQDISQAMAGTRTANCIIKWLSDLQYIVTVEVSGDSNDVSTISGGGSVTLTGVLSVCSSGDFTLEAV